jgi:quercetin dioxygenase-like cupin family protein
MPPLEHREAVRYRWDDMSEDAPMPLLTRRRVLGEQAAVARVVLRKGCDVKTHAHENEQFSVVISGCLRFGLGAEGSAQRRELRVSAGEMLHLPGGVPHSAFAEQDTVVLDIFSPPSRQTGIDRQGH